MPQYPDIFYKNPFVGTIQSVDTSCVVDAMTCDSVVPNFITSGYGHSVTPLPRMTYDVMQGWNLAVFALVLLVVVLNRQLYPRQFRQMLSVPGGVSHTNQLLREWSPVRSFLGNSFMLVYIAVLALFIQKSLEILSRDLSHYEGVGVFAIIFGCVVMWLLLRFALLYVTGWMFEAKEAFERQMTVQLSVAMMSVMVLSLLLLLMLYNPYSAFVWIGMGIIVLAALMRLLLGINETRVATKIPAFYIFLYLCTLEIAPVATVLTAGLRYLANGSVF